MKYPAKKQTGFVLITGLLVLLMLTVIMLTAMRTAALEERMAGNMRSSNIAFQAAESSLREAEGLFLIEDKIIGAVDGQGGTVNPFHPFKLSGGPFQNTGEAVCVKGLCGPSSPPASSNLDALSKEAFRTAATGIANIQQPEYIMELMFIEPSTDSRRLYATFRITTRATGDSAEGGKFSNSQVQLQSTYRAHVLSFVH